jgi:putative permease
MKLKKFEQQPKHVDNIPIEAINLDSEQEQPPKPDKAVGKNVFQPNSKYFTIVIYGLLFVLGAILIYKFIGNWPATVKSLGNIFHILSPFLIGGMIALVLYPFIKALYNRFFMGVCHIKSKKAAKMLSILVAYLIAVGAFAVLIGFVVPQIYKSITEIANQAPVWYENIRNWFTEFEDKHTNSSIDYNFINQKIEDALPKLVDYMTGALTNMVPYILNTSMAILSGVLNLVIAIIVSIYMISDNKNIFYHFKRFLYAVLPRKTADNTRIICKNCASIFINYIIGKSFDSIIVMIICFIIMLILKLPYAVLISVIVGITNMIPYFGPYIGGVIGGVIIVIASPIKLIIFVIMIVCIQQVDGLLIGPRIIGSTTGLKPVWVVFSITVGGALFGVIGMFLGVPVFAVLSYLLNITVQHFLDKRKVTVQPYDPPDDL